MGSEPGISCDARTVTDSRSRIEAIERGWVGAVVVAGALVALVAWSVQARMDVLTASPFPLGVDGYFYPIQLRSLVEGNGLAIPASPLSFYLMLPFAAATDPITGAKLGAAVLGALVAIPVYGVGVQLGGRRAAGLVAAALATVSAGSMYLTIEFVKNGIGITVGVAALWCVIRALERPTRGWIGIALAATVAAALTHKMAAGMVIAIAVPAAIAEAAGRGVLRGRRLIYVLATLGGAAIVALIAGIVAPQRFLSPSDLGLVAHAIGGPVEWDLPALVTRNLRITLGHEPLIAALVVVIAAIALVADREHKVGRGIQTTLRLHRERRGPLTPGTRMAAWMIVLLGVVIALPVLDVHDPQGLGFRLRIAAFVPMALGAAIALRLVLAAVQTSAASGLLVVVAIGLALRTPGRRTEGAVMVHPALVTSAYGLTSKLSPGQVVIMPERHLAFLIAWYTRAPVRIRPEGVPRERRVRVLPLGVFIGVGSPLDKQLMRARTAPGVAPPIGVHPRHPNGMVLVPEATWDWMIERLPPKARDHWARWPTI